MNQNALHYCYGYYVTVNRQTYIKTCLRDFVSLPISQCFQKLVKTHLLLLDCLKACQSALIRNIRFFTFSFITTTLPDVLNKNRYQYNTV